MLFLKIARPNARLTGRAGMFIRAGFASLVTFYSVVKLIGQSFRLRQKCVRKTRKIEKNYPREGIRAGTEEESDSYRIAQEQDGNKAYNLFCGKKQY